MNILPKHYVTLTAVASLVCLILGALQYVGESWWDEKAHRYLGVAKFADMPGFSQDDMLISFGPEYQRTPYWKVERGAYWVSWPGQFIARKLIELVPRFIPLDQRLLSIAINLAIIWSTTFAIFLSRKGKYRKVSFYSLSKSPHGR